jgi:hypothetical protein
MARITVVARPTTGSFCRVHRESRGVHDNVQIERIIQYHEPPDDFVAHNLVTPVSVGVCERLRPRFPVRNATTTMDGGLPNVLACCLPLNADLHHQRRRQPSPVPLVLGPDLAQRQLLCSCRRRNTINNASRSSRSFIPERRQ